MKKLLLALSIFLILFSGSIYASSDIKIIIDGHPKIFNPAPLIKNDSTLVPLRGIFEELGAKVTWEDKTRSITAIKDDKTIKLAIGSLLAKVNNMNVYLTVAPEIIKENTYVPLRFVSEALGADVSWNGQNRSININYVIKPQLTSYTLIDSDKFELKRTYVFKNYGDTADVDLKMYLGSMNSSPYQTDEDISINPTPYEITSDEYGNKYAKLKFNYLRPGEEVTITITKNLSNSGINYIFDKDNITNDYSGFSDYSSYMIAQKKIESDNKVIIDMAKKLRKGETNPYNIAKNVYQFVNLHINYNKDERYAGQGALSGLLQANGVCEEYSKLFVALLRANGIPARSVIGYWLTDDNKSKMNNNEWIDVSGIQHEWPEFYLPNVGWVVAEPTFTYTYNGQKTVPWNQFANQDHNGHILLGYRTDSYLDYGLSMRGYGKLNLILEEKREEMKKLE